MNLPKPSRRGLKPRKPIKRGWGHRRRGNTWKASRDRLDALFSLYVKARDGNVCCTCGKRILNSRDWHAGHFIGRAKLATRWDPKNVHSQCGFVCNKVKRGAPQEYAMFLLDRYGADELRRLLRLKHTVRKFSRQELDDLAAALERGGADFELLYASRYL